MKKICSILLVVVLITTVMAACGKNKSEASETLQETIDTPEVITEATAAGSVSDEEATYYNDGDLDDPPEYAEEKADDTAHENDNTVETEAVEETEEVIYAEELTEYEKFLKMSAQEQAAFVESFSDPMGFINWYNEAEAEHNRLKPSYVIDGSVIDAGDLVDNQG